jgi:hypothetical protein
MDAEAMIHRRASRSLPVIKDLQRCDDHALGHQLFAPSSPAPDMPYAVRTSAEGEAFACAHLGSGIRGRSHVLLRRNPKSHLVLSQQSQIGTLQEAALDVSSVQTSSVGQICRWFGDQNP